MKEEKTTKNDNVVKPSTESDQAQRLGIVATTKGILLPLRYSAQHRRMPS